MDSAPRYADRIHTGFEIRGIDCRDALMGPSVFNTRECFRPSARRSSSAWRATLTGYSSPPTQELLGGVNDAAHLLAALDVPACTLVQRHPAVEPGVHPGQGDLFKPVRLRLIG